MLIWILEGVVITEGIALVILGVAYMDLRRKTRD